jgi:hypothetical protein
LSLSPQAARLFGSGWRLESTSPPRRRQALAAFRCGKPFPCWQVTRRTSSPTAVVHDLLFTYAGELARAVEPEDERRSGLPNRRALRAACRRELCCCSRFTNSPGRPVRPTLADADRARGGCSPSSTTCARDQTAMSHGLHAPARWLAGGAF